MVRQNHVVQNPLYIKVLSGLCNVFNCVLSVNSSTVVWGQSSYQCTDCQPSWPGWQGAVVHALPSITLHITSPRKDPNSELKVQFLLNAYCSCTSVKWKKLKLHHHKSGLSVQRSECSFSWSLDHIMRQINTSLTCILLPPHAPL